MVVIDKTTGHAWENLNQVDTAKLLGVTRQTVANWMKKTTIKHHDKYKVYLFACSYRKC